MKPPLANLVDYLEYRKICGDRTVDLEPEAVAALKTLGAKGSPVSIAGGKFHASSAAPPPRSAPERLDTPPTAPAEAGCDFLFVGEQEGIAADRAAYSETLRKMVAAMGYGKGQATFTNVCIGRKVATPPSTDEMAAALLTFRDLLARTRPRGLVILGSVAAQGLLGQADVSAVHGRTFRFDGLPAIPTYHPAYMVKFPAVKRDACRDLCNALKAIGRPVPPALAPFQ